MTDNFENLYEELLQLPQGHHIKPEIIVKLKTNRITPSFVMCLHEILRISAPKKVLSKKLINLYFMNIKLMTDIPKTLIDIINYKTVLLLEIPLFLRFLRYMADIPQRDIVITLFDIYAKENQVSSIFVFLLNNLGVHLFVDLIQKPCFIDLINRLDEKEFSKVFVVYRNRNDLQLRNMKNKILKKKYINFLFKGEAETSYNKKTKYKQTSEHGTLIGAEDNMLKPETHYNYTNASSETIRNANYLSPILSTISEPENNANCDFTFRLSETCKDIKDVENNSNLLSCQDFTRFYDFFKEDKQVILYLIQERTCCISCLNIINELAYDSNNKVRAKAILYADFDNEWLLDTCKEVRQAAINRVLKNPETSSILTLFKGVLTKAQDEFVDVLTAININIKFLFANRQEVGVKPFLTIVKNKKKHLNLGSLNIKDLKGDTKLARFYYKYFMPADIEIQHFLDDDPYTAYLYFKNKEPREEYMSLIRKNLNKVNNLKHYIRITIFLSGYIKLHESFSFTKIIDDKDYIFYSVFDNTADISLETIDTLNFSRALFFVKHYNLNENTKFLIEQYFASNDDLQNKLEVILYGNNVKLFGSFYYLFESLDLTDSVQKMINLHKNRTSLCFYFLRGGNVNILDTNFIIDVFISLRSASNIKANSRIKQIFLTYANRLNTQNKSKLYCISKEIKMYSQNTNCEYIVVNNQLVLESIPLYDLNMYYMCDLIINSLNGSEDHSITIERDDLYQIDPKYLKYVLQTDFTTV